MTATLTDNKTWNTSHYTTFTLYQKIRKQGDRKQLQSCKLQERENKFSPTGSCTKDCKVLMAPETVISNTLHQAEASKATKEG